MSDDTPIKEIIGIMCSGEGFFTVDGIEVFNKVGRPSSVDEHGYAYTTYAVGKNGNDTSEDELVSKLCLKILGLVNAISCIKKEGESVEVRNITIVWRQQPEFNQYIEDESFYTTKQNPKKPYIKSTVSARCTFYSKTPVKLINEDTVSFEGDTDRWMR